MSTTITLAPPACTAAMARPRRSRAMAMHAQSAGRSSSYASTAERSTPTSTMSACGARAGRARIHASSSEHSGEPNRNTKRQAKSEITTATGRTRSRPVTRPFREARDLASPFAVVTGALFRSGAAPPVAAMQAVPSPTAPSLSSRPYARPCRGFRSHPAGISRIGRVRMPGALSRAAAPGRSEA